MRQNAVLGSMLAILVNQSPRLRKTMVSADAANVLPAQHSHFERSRTAVVDHFSTPEVPIFHRFLA